MRFKSVYTPRCLIRIPQISDAPLLHDALKASFKELKKWMPWAQNLASLKDTEYFIQDVIKAWNQPFKAQGERPLIIMDIHNEKFIGATGITPLNLEVPSFEIGYWIDQRLAGQGLMTQAINGLVHYLWMAHFAKRIEIQCDIDNKKSAQLAERLRFPLEARMKNQRMSADRKSVTDTLLYAISTNVRLPNLDVTWD